MTSPASPHFSPISLTHAANRDRETLRDGLAMPTDFGELAGSRTFDRYRDRRWSTGTTHVDYTMEQSRGPW